MLYILTGPDDFSLRCSLKKLKAALGDPSLLEVNTTLFDGHMVTPDELRTACETLPFLAEKRLVIADGLLGRFEPRAKPAKPKKASGASGRKDGPKSFAGCIASLPGSTVLVLIDGRIKSNNPLFKALSSQAQVRTFPLLKNNMLRQWIKERITNEGGSMSPRAMELLGGLVGGNLWIMTSEIKKLALFSQGRQIEEDDVKMLVSSTQQLSVFTMVDAILEFKVGLAERALQELLQAGVAPAYLLFMLSQQARRLLLASEMKKAGRSAPEIQDRLGISLEFVWRKIVEQASRYSLWRLKELYRKLLEADLSIKTGKYDGQLALNILVAELCQKHER